MTHVNIPALMHSARPVVEITDGQAITTSVEIARVFEKRHTHVLDSIKTLAQQLPESNQPNFRLVDYTDDKGERRPAYHLTRDGFTLLAFGFTGKKAMAFKLAYIDAFNKMEAELLQKSRPAPVPLTYRPARKIHSRDDLSFTRRDRGGNLINWHVTQASGLGDWGQHAAIGAAWFDEIVQLARVKPQAAFHAMQFAAAELLPYWHQGHEVGFMERFAHWALTAILAHGEEGLPKLPFEHRPAAALPPEEIEIFLRHSPSGNQANNQPAGARP